MQKDIWDTVIIGAGPAGLMAAIACGERGLRTLVLEGKKTPGAKLLISGGGRCNVTNLRVTEKDYHSGQPRTVRNILRSYPPERALAFFKERGVPMVLEEGTKYFPEAQSAKVVLQALLKALRDSGAVICEGKLVRGVSKKEDLFRISGEGFEYSSKTLVIATGGLSYPGSGSDGAGYAFARSLGHTIVRTTPALTPLITEDPVWRGLAGITLPVRLTALSDGKEISKSEGAFLFTHTGFSGPAVLDISGPWLRCEAKQKKLVADFLPGRRESEMQALWERSIAEHPARSWKRFLADHFPDRLAEALLRKSDIDPQQQTGQTSKKERLMFLRSLFHFPLTVAGFLGYEKAEVTSGGVDLGEVDPKTLGSEICPGLFFAGEVLDVDGRIGGFNFQWAWASGAVVGRAISGVPRNIKTDAALAVKKQTKIVAGSGFSG